MTNTAAPLESFGKIFQGDFIERNGMSLLQLASASGIPVAEIEAIIKDERPLTDDDADPALLFSSGFGCTFQHADE